MEKLCKSFIDGILGDDKVERTDLKTLRQKMLARGVEPEKFLD